MIVTASVPGGPGFKLSQWESAIKSVANIDGHYGGVPTVSMVDPTATPAFGPKSLAASVARFEMTRTPRFELIADRLWMVSRRGDDDVYVVGTCVNGAQCPAADAAVPRDRLFDDLAFVG